MSKYSENTVRAIRNIERAQRALHRANRQLIDHLREIGVVVEEVGRW